MNPLLLTMTFLTAIAILTSSEMVQHIDDAVKDSAFESYTNLSQQCEQKQALAHFEELKEERAPALKGSSLRKRGEYEGKSAKLNYDRGRPPNNSRINLYLVMEGGSESIYYEPTARLIRELYSGQPFFDEVAQAEYRILDSLVHYRELAKDFFFVDELASLEFRDKEAHRCFFRMLKGSPSLLHYVTLDTKVSGNQKKANLMFASDEVLHVLVPNQNHFDEICRFRKQLWEQIEYQEANRKKLPKDEVRNRTYYKNELANFLERIDLGLSKRFDITLGKKGNVIFVQDPASLIVKRERIMKRHL
ncbi:MAG: hypothetical protein S4CHLAM81_15230 [Chlamydiales bacterium]|nr:hypothetical protein [Chlamydiales bacterium]MCH9636292.1 hypothetical protein [Chlamydiales bacterium]